eukprot:CAMPEP_0198305946 /NCGR_PEP_ID=MMETSP1449-20131203/58166_1 /TAXON_ID=420275 /ORGANISM="Attheya septentrionalis, Strain CCMP2084" /LENGTH=247 /DNA_ID=CAMNT_0044008491 /DNA_START=157 /DNA_END=900 /DNA_ORIENTATION=+
MKLCFVGTILAMLVASTVSFAFTTVPRSSAVTTQRNSRSHDNNHHPVSWGKETKVGNVLLFAQSPTPSCVLQRLDLSDTFSRWRFMQKLLDAEVEAADVNEILFRVLNAFVDNPELRPKRRPNDDDDDDDEASVSPPLTAEVRATIEDTLLRHNEHGVGVVWALQDPECAPGRENVLEALETLLPDPVEDENAYKGTWDLVIELHGRESTRIREQEGSLEWKARCLVGRILIYYDFVTDGVIEVPFS